MKVKEMLFSFFNRDKFSIEREAWKIFRIAVCPGWFLHC